MSDRVCIRGCLTPRRHIFVDGVGRECDEFCGGCLPREAEYGHLCFHCHKRLKRDLELVPGQVAILKADLPPSVALSFTMPTEAKVGPVWRTDTDQSMTAMYARPNMASPQESEPIRLACLDLAQQVEDWMSAMVERLVDDYGMSGPDRKLAPVERDPARCGHPPYRFEVTTASAWLVEQIERVEWYESVGDDAEDLSMLLAQAHALRPWREQATRIPGIPCPNCQREALVQFAGESDVECLNPRCKSIFDPDRYGIWTRILESRLDRGRIAGEEVG